MRILIDGQTLLTPEMGRGIGTYFRNVVEQTLQLDFVNEYYLNTAKETQIQGLSKWAQGRLEIISNEVYDPAGTTRPSGAEAYSQSLADDVVKHGIDLYWTPNPLMTNVFLPRKIADCRFAATIYDLIILVRKDWYLNKWARPLKAAYLEKLAILESDYDLFVHISANTKRDFETELSVKEKLHLVTPLAASSFFRPDPFPVIARERNYILYIGGFDPRKNMERAVEAFAALQRNHPGDEDVRDTWLYIVCTYDASAKARLLKHASKFGVDDRVLLTGFVRDGELRSLNQKARCLFFPSLYEGFGLPILEALACGIPVAAANNSSLPEVGGDYAAYFDAYDPEDMARVLRRTLKEPMDLEPRRKRHRYANRFSWAQTALATMAAFETCTAATVRRQPLTISH